VKVKKLENDKPLRFEGKGLDDGSGKLRVEGVVIGVNELVHDLIKAPIDNLTNEMEARSGNTKELLAKFRDELLKDAAKIIIDLKNDLSRAQSEIEDLKNKITEMEALKTEIAEMKKPKSSIPFRFSDYAEIQRLKAEQNE